MDAFLLKYDDEEIRIASEFLSNWLPFLSLGLCKTCKQTLSDRIRSLDSEENFTVSTPSIGDLNHCEEDYGNCSTHSIGSRKDSADDNDNAETYSLGSWKDDADGLSEHAAAESSTSEIGSSAPLASTSEIGSSAPLASPWVKKSWADELAAEEENEPSSKFVNAHDICADRTPLNEAKPKVELSRDQREYIRFCSVKRKKDFICLERVNGKFVNILDGLELHSGVFSAAEQTRIVRYVEQLQELGRNGRLKERTYSAPRKWMRGKGCVTLQFGCCYNYATDKIGNTPGILRNEIVDPLPHLLKVMIKRLVRWHVLPPSCVPDSCIINISEEGDCIPLHIDNHDFVRPFCTVSFLSECEILFGSNLKIVGAGEFTGSFPIHLPVGSVLVLNGNGADVAKHCVPVVPTKRISITFRKMDESKWPLGYVPEPDLQGLQPLSDERDKSRKYNASRSRRSSRKQAVGREEIDRGRGLIDGHPDARYSGRVRQGPANRQRFQVDLEK